MFSYPALVTNIKNGLVSLIVSVEGCDMPLEVPIDMCDWAKEDQQVIVETHKPKKMLEIRPIKSLELDPEDLLRLNHITKDIKDI